MCCHPCNSSAELSEFSDDFQHDTHVIAVRSPLLRSSPTTTQNDLTLPMTIDPITPRKESFALPAVVIVCLVLSFHIASVDASSNVTQKTDVLSFPKPDNTSLPRIDTSLSHADTTQTQGGSSSSPSNLIFLDSSLPEDDQETRVTDLTGKVVYPDESSDLGKEDCLENQFWDEGNLRCENCTTCGPGTQHQPQSPCGYGIGVKAICEACRNRYYQEKYGYSGLRCQPCVWCDEYAETLAECSRTKNTQCGPCAKGRYYGLINICFVCTSETDHSDCAESFLKNPLTQPPSLPPSTASPSSLPTSPSSLPTSLQGSTQLPSVPLVSSQANPEPSEPRTLPPDIQEYSPENTHLPSQPSTQGPRHEKAYRILPGWSILLLLITIPVAVVLFSVGIKIIRNFKRRDTSTNHAVRYDSESSQTSSLNGDEKAVTIIAQCTDPNTSPPPMQHPLPPTPPRGAPDHLVQQKAGNLYCTLPGLGPEPNPQDAIAVADPESELSMYHTLSSHPDALEGEGIGLLHDYQGDSGGPQAMGPAGQAQWPSGGDGAEPGSPSSAHCNEFFESDGDVSCQGKSSHLPMALKSY